MSLWKWGFVPERFIGFDNYLRIFTEEIVVQVDKKAILLAQDTEQEFTNGRSAMEIGTTARTSSKLDLIKDKFKWGITLIPQGDSIKKVTELHGGNQVLFKTTPEKEMAGWIFLKYFAGANAQSIYAAKTGYFPAVKSAQDTDLLKKNYADKCLSLSRHIPSELEMLIVTNSPSIALYLMQKKGKSKIFLVGGELSSDGMTSGHKLHQELKQYRFDKAMFSCAGLTTQGCF